MVLIKTFTNYMEITDDIGKLYTFPLNTLLLEFNVNTITFLSNNNARFVLAATDTEIRVNSVQYTFDELKTILPPLLNVNYSGGGVISGVASVNGKTGDVILVPSDIGAYRISEVNTLLDGKVDNDTFNDLVDDVESNSTAIASKANTSDLTALSGKVDINTASIATINNTLLTKADNSTVQTLSTKVDGFDSRITNNETAITSKANTSDLTVLSGKVDINTASIATINNTLLTKADNSTVNAINDKVLNLTASVNTNTQNISTKASQTEVTTISGTVSSLSDELDTVKENLSTLGNTSVNSITSANSGIVVSGTSNNKILTFKIDETPTKGNVVLELTTNGLKGTVQGLGFRTIVIDVLPDEGAFDYYYLLKQSEPDYYKEYVWAEIEPDVFDYVYLGDTTTELTDYVTTSELNTALSNYSTTEALNVVKGELDDAELLIEANTTAINGKADISITNGLKTITDGLSSDIETINGDIDALELVVNGKVSQSDFNGLSTKVDQNISDIESLETSLGGKADVSALNTVSSDLDLLETTVDNLSTSVGNKVSQSDFNGLVVKVNQNTSDIETLETNVESRALQSSLDTTNSNITTVDNKFTNYYDKTTTKTKIDNMFEVVEESDGSFTLNIYPFTL